MYPANQTAAKKPLSKLGIALLMLTIIVLFTSLGAAYMRSRQELSLVLPNLFYVNIFLLALSSLFLHIGWKSKSIPIQRNLLLGSILLGLVFLCSQFVAWGQLYAQGIHISESGQKASFLYLLSGLHALHILGGLGFLIFVYVRFSRTGKRYLEMSLFFWHFLGLLWVYLIALLWI